MSSALKLQDRKPSSLNEAEIKKREKRVEERESQLDDREARLYQKELQVSSQVEDAQRKVELLSEQR